MLVWQEIILYYDLQSVNKLVEFACCMDINFSPPNHFSLRCSKIEIFRFAAKLGSERSQVVTRYRYKVCTLSLAATEVGGCTYGCI